jgi:hypothetical protein
MLPALALLFLSGCDKPTTPTRAGPDGSPATTAELELEDATADEEAEATAEREPFDDAQLFFELNATDNDLGLQLFLDAEGWRRVRVVDPREKDMVELVARGWLAKLGITELRFESAEPSPEEVFALFPPGQYKFRGRTVEGGGLGSNVELSHDLPPKPSFTPSNGEVVDRGHAVVKWNTPGAEQVEIIIENDELGHVLDVTLSASTTRLRIPPQFLVPGMEYKIEVLSIAENGNRTIVESTFRTKS